MRIRNFLKCALVLGCALLVQPSHATTTFSGLLISAPGGEFRTIAGSIHLTVTGGEVGFRSTLFRRVVTDGPYECVLMVGNKEIHFALGSGVDGTYDFGEFFAPFPGITPICGWQFMLIDPGFNVLPRLEGTRFTGNFHTFAGLEKQLLGKEPTV